MGMSAHVRGSKPYDAWLHWYLSERCNLNCDFCGYSPPSGLPKAKGTVTLIDIPALLRTLEDADKIFKMSFTGAGEPFLVPNIIDACVHLTKRHYVEFVTNLTPEAITEFAHRIDPARVGVIHASLHTEALRKLGLLETYIRHYLLLREKGFAVRCAELAHPRLLDEAHALRSQFRERGIELSFTPFLGVYKGKRYPESFTGEELAQFDIDPDSLRVFSPYGRICNAGYNVAVIRENGDVRPCDAIGEVIGNVYSRIHFRESLILCPFERCVCPLNKYDEYLYARAMEENSAVLFDPLCTRAYGAYAWLAGKKSMIRYTFPPRMKRFVRRVVPDPLLAARRRWRAGKIPPG